MKIVEPSYEILYPVDDLESLSQLRRIELAARTCYKSEDKITVDSYRKFIKMLVDKEHDAMLGFGEMHVKFICDRGVSHELVRHRLCEFAQESTRYCNYKSKGIQVVCPEEVYTKDDDTYAIWEDTMDTLEVAYDKLIESGCKPQIARSVLPTCVKTEIHMKADFQEWRHIFKQRTSVAAHPQMRELMVPLLANVKSLIPVVFDDIEVWNG
jgi:thymidylate synthase (FAD)